MNEEHKINPKKYSKEDLFFNETPYAMAIAHPEDLIDIKEQAMEFFDLQEKTLTNKDNNNE